MDKHQFREEQIEAPLNIEIIHSFNGEQTSFINNKTFVSPGSQYDGYWANNSDMILEHDSIQFSADSNINSFISFPNVLIPDNAIVVSAYLHLHAASGALGIDIPEHVGIAAHRVADSDPEVYFNTAANADAAIAMGSRTTAIAGLTPGHYSEKDWCITDVTSIVKELHSNFSIDNSHVTFFGITNSVGSMPYNSSFTSGDSTSYYAEPPKLTISFITPLTEDVDFSAAMTLTFNISSNNETLTIPCQDVGTFDAVIDWGDNSSQSQVVSYDDSALTHTYANAGTYDVRIAGLFPNIYFNATGDCAKLTRIKQIGNTGLLTLERAFIGCNNLTAIDNYDSVSDTSAVTSMAYAFSGTGLIGDVVLGCFQGNAVTDMSYMFNGCHMDSLVIVDLVDTPNLINLERMFWFATGLDSVAIYGWDTSKVTNFHGFARATGMSSFNFDGMAVNSGLDFSQMFYQCGFSEVNVSTWNPVAATTTRQMFYLCPAYSYTFGTWYMPNNTDVSLMFATTAYSELYGNFENLIPANISSSLGWENWLQNRALDFFAYDAMINAWNHNLPYGSGIVINCPECVRTPASTDAYASLTSVYGYTINDLGEYDPDL